MASIDPGRHEDAAVHSELREALVAYRSAVGNGGLGAFLDVTERREVFAESSRRGMEGRSRPEGVTVDSHDVPGLGRAPDVRTRLYRPTQPDAVTGAAWIYVHGGGMVLGDLDSSDLAAAHLAADSGCTIMTVDYRLAPEVRFPGPLDDCAAALGWMHDHAPAVGVDPARIGVYGVSAGGALAAGLAQRSRDGQALPVAKQILVYPMLDDRVTLPAETPDAVAGTWTRESNARAWDDYLGPELDRGDPPVHAVPARAGSLRGLPPTYIEVGSIDILSVEAMDYARRLLTSGVATELHVYPGAYHAFDAMGAGSALAQSALARRIRAMNEF